MERYLTPMVQQELQQQHPQQLLLRIRESDQLKTVLELYDMEIHEKTPMADYQKI